MKLKIIIAIILGGLSSSTFAITNSDLMNIPDRENIHHDIDSNQHVFWQELQKLCGKAFQGKMIAGPDNDTTFAKKTLVMHVRKCNDQQIYIPFFVGNDRSRTWVLSRNASGITLKHDHRHNDGKPDAVTNYGGSTTNSGAKIRQIFPADQETANMLPAAVSNVWWIDLVPNEYFIYNLRRVNIDRVYSIKFDLKQSIAIPEKPWGWKN